MVFSQYFFLSAKRLCYQVIGDQAWKELWLIKNYDYIAWKTINYKKKKSQNVLLFLKEDV